jgi:hypothetical protein
VLPRCSSGAKAEDVRDRAIPEAAWTGYRGARSRENVELVRGVIEAHQRGISRRVFAAYDPEIEWHISG